MTTSAEAIRERARKDDESIWAYNRTHTHKVAHEDRNTLLDIIEASQQARETDYCVIYTALTAYVAENIPLENHAHFTPVVITGLAAAVCLALGGTPSGAGVGDRPSPNP